MVDFEILMRWTGENDCSEHGWGKESVKGIEYLEDVVLELKVRNWSAEI